MDEDRDDDEQPPRIGLRSIVASTLAAAVGVQSRSNRERDFGSGRVAPFIVAGLIFTAVLVIALVLVVRLVIGAVA